MWDFPELILFPLSKWMDRLVDWMTITWDPFFKAVRDFLLVPLLQTEKYLLWLPWFVAILFLVFIITQIKSESLPYKNTIIIMFWADLIAVPLIVSKIIESGSKVNTETSWLVQWSPWLLALIILILFCLLILLLTRKNAENSNLRQSVITISRYHLSATIMALITGALYIFIPWLATSTLNNAGLSTQTALSKATASEWFLIWLPWLLTIGVFALIYLLVKLNDSQKMVAGIVIGMMFIGTLGLWDLSMETLAIVIIATLFSILAGVPLGIMMAQSNSFKDFLRPLLDMMQTMPSFVYLIPALMFFGLGKVPALIAVFIYAVPPAIRLTDLGIRQVSANVVEASRAFGTTRWQLLFKVQLPLATPTIMAGVNQTIMMALAMVIIASMIGARGLGSEVLNGISRLEVGRGFNGGISIVILAIIIDRITQGLAKDTSKKAV